MSRGDIVGVTFSPGKSKISSRFNERELLRKERLAAIKYAVFKRARAFAKTETPGRKTAADIDLISRVVFRAEYFVEFFEKERFAEMF